MNRGIGIIIAIVVIIFGLWLYNTGRIAFVRTPVPTAVITNSRATAYSSVPTRTLYPVVGSSTGTSYSSNYSSGYPGYYPGTQGGCYVGGCSNQICSDQPGMISTCEYRPEYGCYAGARCERQATGQCGWTMTPQLYACLTGTHY